jgi:hypothetical protein
MEGDLIHDHSGSQGENLYWCSASGPTSYADAAQGWIDEKEFYHGQALTGEPQDERTQWGHYTQIIWPEAARVGMGHFDAPHGDPEWPRGGVYVVARYDVRQITGQRAWRPSGGNPFAYSNRTDHGGSAWSEEQWIQKYGTGHHL